MRVIYSRARELRRPGRELGRSTGQCVKYIITQVLPARDGYRRVQVKCDCGASEPFEADLFSVVCGNTRSCGCVKIESIKKMAEVNRTHGGVGTPLYEKLHTWNKKCAPGENVTFSDFKAWALDAGYQDGYVLHRRNTKQPYSKENCFWSSTLQRSEHSG